MAFGDQGVDISLVSEGSETVLINKEFFLSHMSGDVLKTLRTTVRTLENTYEQQFTNRAYAEYATQIISTVICSQLRQMFLLKQHQTHYGNTCQSDVAITPKVFTKLYSMFIGILC